MRFYFSFSRHHRNHLRLAAILILALAVCVTAAPAKADPMEGTPPTYFVDENTLPFEALPGATALWGVHAGAGYRLEVPDNWNGSVVIWAHPRAGVGFELTVDNHPLRALLIPLGFAWASSSYSSNAYDVAGGVLDIHTLANRIGALIGQPSRVYLTGAEMGGHIISILVEQFANSYDAALPICGAQGGYAVFDYYLDFNVAAQQLGTGSSQFPVDPLEYIAVTVPTIKANLEAFPGGWPLVLNATGENLKNLTALRSGGFRPNFEEGWFFWNTFPERSSGPGNFLFDLSFGDGTLPSDVDNSETVYQFDSDPSLSVDEQALNAGVVRIARGPSSQSRGLGHFPQVTGDIHRPVLTLHNLGDLFVPILNEVVYANRVASQGKSDLLVQRAIRGVLHCDFTAAEFSTAFLDLVAWVEAGIKPGGDDFLDPAEVADPIFGCAYTDGDHVLGTPCP